MSSSRIFQAPAKGLSLLHTAVSLELPLNQWQNSQWCSWDRD